MCSLQDYPLNVDSCSYRRRHEQSSHDVEQSCQRKIEFSRDQKLDKFLVVIDHRFHDAILRQLKFHNKLPAFSLSIFSVVSGSLLGTIKSTYMFEWLVCRMGTFSVNEDLQYQSRRNRSLSYIQVGQQSTYSSNYLHTSTPLKILIIKQIIS